jgi:hypothetical protein
MCICLYACMHGCMYVCMHHMIKGHGASSSIHILSSFSFIKNDIFFLNALALGFCWGLHDGGACTFGGTQPCAAAGPRHCCVYCTDHHCWQMVSTSLCASGVCLSFCTCRSCMCVNKRVGFHMHGCIQTLEIVRRVHSCTPCAFDSCVHGVSRHKLLWPGYMSARFRVRVDILFFVCVCAW